jgi:hypothetical protein
VKEMQIDEETEWMLYLHFGPHLHKKKLKCENCLDYKEKVCDGKGYKYREVIDCMSEHAKNNELGIITNIDL